MQRVVVEWERSTQSTGAAPDLGAAPRAACMELHRVRLLQRLVSLDGLRMICIFEAPDAESVRRLLRGGCLEGVAPLRVWSAAPDAPER